MKHRRRVYLVETTCRRCGKPLLTANRSLMGADQAKMVYGGVCPECARLDLRDEVSGLLQEMDEEAIGSMTRKSTEA